MFVRHLAYFVALAREKHFARAAEVCNITQPTLSAAIRKLEDDLQAPLVVREHRFIGLTAEGRRALAWAQQILSDYDGLRLDLAGVRSGLAGTLRLGVVPAAMPMVSWLTARFLTAHSATDVEAISMTSRSIKRGIETFEIDAGLTYLDNEPLVNVRRLPFYREHYVFAAGEDSRHAGRRTISWRRALDERLCLLGADMQNRRIIENVAKQVGAELRPTVVTNSFLGICSHLRQGGFASIVPESIFYILGAVPGIVAIELVAPLHSQAIGLVSTDRDPPPPMGEAILAVARDAKFRTEIAAASRAKV